MVGYTVRRKSSPEETKSPTEKVLPGPIPFESIPYRLGIDTSKLSVDNVLFTPETCRLLLENHNKRNRGASLASIDSMARDLLANRWADTGERVTFGVDGNIVSAQHRFQAGVKSGVPFVSDVKFGIDEAGRLATDSGRPRSNGDQLVAITGDKAMRPKATLLTGVKNILNTHRDKLSPGLALAMEKDFSDGLETFLSESKGPHLYKKNPCAAAFVIAGTAYPNKTRDLLRNLLGGEMATSASKAIYRYASTFFNKNSDLAIASKVLFGIYAHMEGIAIEQLSAREKDLEKTRLYFLAQILKRHELKTLGEIAPKLVETLKAA